jgi:predicted NUDIX family phosphoesterase
MTTESNTIVPEAARTLFDALRTDKGYAISWYANLVMASVDSGVPRVEAEEAAHRFLSLLLGTDTKALYPDFATVVERPALVFNRDALEAVFSLVPEDSCIRHPLPHYFWGLPTSLASRQTCETDPSLQQIIPYIILRNDQHIFAYTRGSASGEERLRAKLSIGLGGHVDIAQSNLYKLLTYEAQREILEEVGIYIEADRFRFDSCLIDKQPDGNAVPVGSVHFGLPVVVDISREERDSISTEKDVVTKATWIPTSKLILDLSFYTRLEPWSLACLNMLT